MSAETKRQREERVLRPMVSRAIERMRELYRRKPSSAELQCFGFGLGTGIIVVFGLLRPWLRHYRAPIWPWPVGVSLWATALLYAPALTVPFNVVNLVAKAVGWCVTQVVCGIIFYGVFTPLGLVMRASGRDPMARKFDPQASTYRVLSRARTRESMERPF